MNIFKAYWNGERQLWQAFWLVLVFGGILYATIMLYLMSVIFGITLNEDIVVKSNDQLIEQLIRQFFQKAYDVFTLSLVPYYLWSFVSVWRCARHSCFFYKWLARAIIILFAGSMSMHWFNHKECDMVDLVEYSYGQLEVSSKNSTSYVFEAKVAKTKQQQEFGLMLDALDNNSSKAMVFLIKANDDVDIKRYNNQPVDLLFIDKHGIIIDSMPHITGSDQSLTMPKTPLNMVVAVQAGIIELLKLKKGYKTKLILNE